MFTNKCHGNKGVFLKNFFESVKWYLNLFFAVIIYIYFCCHIFAAFCRHSNIILILSFITGACSDISPLYCLVF